MHVSRRVLELLLNEQVERFISTAGVTRGPWGPTKRDIFQNEMDQLLSQLEYSSFIPRSRALYSSLSRTLRDLVRIDWGANEGRFPRVDFSRALDFLYPEARPLRANQAEMRVPPAVAASRAETAPIDRELLQRHLQAYLAGTGGELLTEPDDVLRVNQTVLSRVRSVRISEGPNGNRVFDLEVTTPEELRAEEERRRNEQVQLPSGYTNIGTDMARGPDFGVERRYWETAVTAAFAVPPGARPINNVTFDQEESTFVPLPFIHPQQRKVEP